VKGIEPSYSAWKSDVFTRFFNDFSDRSKPKLPIEVKIEFYAVGTPLRLRGLLGPEPTSGGTRATTLRVFGATVIREVCEAPVCGCGGRAVSRCCCRAQHQPLPQPHLALEDLLVPAQTSGALGADDPPRMMEQFFALLWGDLLVGRLLGAARRSDPTPRSSAEQPKRPLAFSSSIRVA
jgi:hypothetical protein